MKYRHRQTEVDAYQTDKELDIETSEGVMHADAGDYIITGVNGETYPCKPDIFEELYERIPSDDILKGFASCSRFTIMSKEELEAALGKAHFRSPSNFELCKGIIEDTEGAQ